MRFLSPTLPGKPAASRISFRFSPALLRLCPPLLLLLGALGPTMEAASAAPKFEIIELPLPQPGIQTEVRDLNSHDQIVGEYDSETQSGWDPFIWLPEPAYGLPAGFNPVSFAERSIGIQALNDDGLMGGESRDYSTLDILGAFIGRPTGEIVREINWTNGEAPVVIRDLSNRGGYVASVFGNPSRIIVSVAGEDPVEIMNPNGAEHPASVERVAAPLNEHGHVVGEFRNTSNAWRNFLWKDGTAAMLDGAPLNNGPDAPDDGRPTSINDADQIVGTNESGVFLWLPTPAYGLPAGYNVISSGRGLPFINNRGQVVTPSHLWDQGKLYAMADLLPPEEPGEVARIHGFNDSGTVLALLTRPVGNGNFEDLYVLLKAKTAEVRLTLESPPEDQTIGSWFSVTITVESTLDEPVTIVFDDPMLAEAASAGEGSGILAIGEAGAPESFTLAPDDEPLIFVVPVQAVNGGRTTLKSALSVTPADGIPTGIEATTEVVVNPLELSFRMKPLVNGRPIVNLELDDEGVPHDEEGNVVEPKVEVTLKNASDRSVNAFIQGVDPLARDDSAVVGRIDVTGTFPDELGELAAGQQIVREYPVELHEDGRFEFQVLATGAFTGSLTNLSRSGRGAPIAVGEPYPMQLELQQADATGDTPLLAPGSIAVQPGGQARFLGTVRNLTSNATLHFSGIRAHNEGNAFGGTLTTTLGGAATPPHIVDHAVDANSSVVLLGEALTDANGAPTGTITWQLPDNAVLIDDATGDETALTADDILVTTDIGGWGGDDLTVRLVQDNTRPIAPPLTWWTSWSHFSHGVMVGIGQWTYGTFDALGALGTLAGDPSAVADALGEGTRAIWESAELIALGWEDMTPAERDAFVLDAVNDVVARAQLMRQTGLPFDPDEIEQVRTFTSNAIYSLFGGIESAYAANDPAQIAELWGQVTGNIAMEVATGLVPTPRFTQYADAAELTRLAASADNVRLANSQQQMLRTIRSGPVTADIARQAWGAGGDELTWVQQVLRQLGVKGYARERSPNAIRLLEELQEAVLKPELMKPKGISDLDRLILGDNLPKLTGKPPGNAELDLDDITAIFLPENNAVIRARLTQAGEPPEVIEAAIARANARRAEYQEYLPQFKQWRDGEGIPVAFNYRDNDAIPFDPNTGPGSTRAFEFQTLGIDGGPAIHVPKMADKDGVLKFITGDTDWVHFSWLDGTPLDPKAAGRLFDLLNRKGVLPHGDAAAWMKNGQTLFKAKANQLVDYIKGEKALLEVTGDSLRAARIVPELTRFARDGRKHLIFFDGGSKSLQKALAQAELENAFSVLNKLAPFRPLVVPYLWIQRLAEDDTTLGGADWTFSDSPDAVLVRQNAEGQIERFDGIAWVPWDPPAGGDTLELTPTTTVTADVSAGATEVPILELDQLWGEELAGHLAAWFEAGVSVIFAPGEPTQEIRTVTALGSLILDRPLTYAHPAGTLVAMVDPARLPPSIAKQPLAQAAPAGKSLTLSVQADAPGPFTYQWYLNGVAIPGATGSSYTVPTAQRFHAGDYQVTVTNANGAVTSESASVTVAAPPPNNARMLNLSTRGLSLADPNLLIPGFVIGGSGTKKLLIRAVGPELAKMGVAADDVLPDPRMVLKRRNGAVFEDVTSNDNWIDNANAVDIALTAQQVFAFPLESDLEAALLVDLAPGQYTVVADGVDGATGTAMVELYDADAPNPSARLLNISNRGFCGVGDQVMIPGFWVSHEGAKTFLIRVVGPSLGKLGVTSGTMDDPKLEIYPSGAKTPILSNDDWGDNPDAAYTAAIAQQVFAFSLAEGGTDAALVVTLPPGGYTVVGSSADGTSTGVILVEVYLVP